MNTENNKLLAKFMGNEFTLMPNTDGKCYTIKESWDIIHEDDFIADRATFAYNTSWDILIPVVEKIEQVNEGVPTQLSNISLFSNIDEVYKSVLGFIKLNTNN